MAVAIAGSRARCVKKNERACEASLRPRWRRNNRENSVREGEARRDPATTPSAITATVRSQGGTIRLRSTGPGQGTDC